MTPVSLSSRQTLAISAYGASLIVEDVADGAVRDQLLALVPRRALVPIDALSHRSIRYRIERVPVTRNTDGWIYQVTRDGRPVLAGEDPADVASRLRSSIELTLAMHARDGLFIHAGAVVWRGQGILIPGRSMSGKSTLVAELVRRGATYYSDEYAVLDDDGDLHPYARPICLRDDQGRDRWRHPEDLGGAVGDRPVPVAVVIATQYRPDCLWQPALSTGSRAVLPIIDNAVMGREDPRRTLRVAAALGSRVLGLKGPRPDVEVTAPAILRLVDDLVDGRPCVRPPRYVRIEGFLPPEPLRAMFDFVSARTGDFAASGVDTGKEQRIDPAYRRSRTLFDLDSVWDPIRDRLESLIPLVRQELGMSWFPPGPIERQLTIHREGDFFKVHTDNGSPGTAGRRLTAVFHFFREPRRFSGGALNLYETLEHRGGLVPGPLHTRLEPLSNSIVLFRSDTFHDVQPVQCGSEDIADGRCAVTIWCREGPHTSLSSTDPPGRSPELDTSHAR